MGDTVKLPAGFEVVEQPNTEMPEGFEVYSQPQAQGQPLPFMDSPPETDTFMTQLGSAANEAIANVGGLPMDASRGIANLMGADIPTDAWGGSDYIRKQLTDQGFIQPESQDPTLQGARRAGRMATEAVLPLGAAAKLAPVVRSPILKEALTSVINNPAKVLGLEAFSGATAGVSGQVAREFTDNPLYIGAAELGGGLTPTGVMAATGGLTRKALGAGQGSDVAKTVEDFASIGATPTVSQATGSKAAGAVEKVSAMIPFGGARFQKNANKTYNAIKDTIAKNVEELGGRNLTKQDVGGVVRKGLKGFADRTSKQADKYYDDISALVPKQAPVPMTKTRELLEELTGSIEGADSLTNVLTDPDLVKLAKAVRLDAGDANILPYEALKPLRKKIWKKASNFSNESSSDYKRLYGAILEDTNTAASSISPAASRAVDKANKYYSGYKTRVDTHLQKVMDKVDDSHITDMLELSGRKGSAQLNAVKKSLTPDEWNLYVSRQIDNLGKAKDSPDFSTDKFITQYNKMSPEVKDVLFANKGGMKRDLETILNVSKNLKLDKAILANPSGTADRGVASILALGAYFNPVLAAKAGAGVAGNKMLSVAMTSPKTLNWLAKGVNMRPEAMAGHITRLATIAQRGDQDDQEAALEIINILSPSEAE